MSETPKESKNYISLLSVIAAISVVMMHTNGCYWEFSPTEGYWITANIIDGLLYFNVPVFFMISGVTLINYRKRYSTKVYFIKRITKTVIPFILWSIIGLLFRVYCIKDIKPEEIDLLYFLNSINKTNIVASIYWFFPVLFSIYLFIPILSAIEANKRKDVFIYIAVFGFIFNSLIPFIFRFVSLDSLAIKFIAGSVYLFYPVIGFLISENEIKKWLRITIYFGGLVGLLLKILGTYYDSMHIGRVSNLYSGYDNVPAFLYSIAVFLLIKQMCKGSHKDCFAWKIIAFLKEYTFPIYLMHWFVYKTALKVFMIDSKSLLYRIGFPFVIIIVIICITWVLRKIPIIKRIVP